MPDESRFLDVWILETNTVYRDVPFAVVTDWVQQSRLLAEDKVRMAGTAEWFPLGSMPAFAPYVPKAEPFRAEDQAEALEPVQVDIAWRSRPSEMDEDVDMIPLIDISLVLLIFFMMTAAVGAMGGWINTPPVKYKHITLDPEMYWIGVSPEGDRVVYSFGKGNRAPEKLDTILTQAEALERLDNELKEKRAKVRIMAHRDLPFDIVKKMSVELEKRRKPRDAGPGIEEIFAEVSERQQR